MDPMGYVINHITAMICNCWFSVCISVIVVSHDDQRTKIDKEQHTSRSEFSMITGVTCIGGSEYSMAIPHRSVVVSNHPILGFFKLTLCFFLLSFDIQALWYYIIVLIIIKPTDFLWVFSRNPSSRHAFKNLQHSGQTAVSNSRQTSSCTGFPLGKMNQITDSNPMEKGKSPVSNGKSKIESLKFPMKYI